MRRWWPVGVLILFLLAITWEVCAKGWVLLPGDLLTGAYFPWLAYKWGYLVGVPVKNPVISDAFNQFFVWKDYWREMVMAGKLPVWNPYMFSGYPFLATYHTQVFFPMNILMLLPKFINWNLFIWGSHVAAAIFAYIFLGEFSRNKWARVTGAVVFCLGGFMSTWSQMGTAGWGMAWLPFILWCERWLVKTGRSKWGIGMAAGVATGVLAGQAQIAALTLGITVVYGIYLGGYKWIKYLILGAALTAIQIVPTLLYNGQTVRQAENWNRDFNYGLVETEQIVRLWAADFFGNPVTGNQWGGWAYHENSSFLGTVSIPLILAFVFWGKHREKKFWVGILLMLLAVIFKNPLSEWIYSRNIPLLTYSSAGRMWYGVNLAAAVLLVMGLEQWTERKIKWGIIAAIGILGIITGVVAIWAGQGFGNVIARNLVIPVGMAAVLTGLTRLENRWAVLIIAILLMLDLGRYYRKYNPIVPPGLVFPETKMTRFLRDQPGRFKIAKPKSEILPSNTWMYYRLESIEGYDPMQPLEYARLMNTVSGHPLTNKPTRYSELENFVPEKLSEMGVKFLVTAKYKWRDELEKAKWKLVFDDPEGQVWENPQAKMIKEVTNYWPEGLSEGAIITAMALGVLIATGRKDSAVI